jgi:lysophospholipase L1-like esterase
MDLSSTISSSAITHRSFSKPMEFLLKVIMVVTGPLLLIGLLEGVAYIWEHSQANGTYAWELVASRRIDLLQYPEPGAGYTLMKPGSHYEWQGIPVDINSHGLREPETTYEKPPNTFRILNLGDSVAMGWGIREEDTYGQQLECLLNEKTDDNLRYEVINAGVPGWNLDNELAYLQAEGLKYEPDLILLDLTIVNDIYGKSALVAHKRPALIEWLRANTYFWPFLTVQLRWLEAHANGRERIGVIDPPTEPAKYFPMDSAADQWVEIWNPILAMHRLAQEHKARFMLVLFPLEFQVVDENYSTLPQELLTTKAIETDIPVLDLLPVFQQACQEKAGGVCQLEDRYLFADVWMHPSAYGHKLIAMEVDAFLDKFLDETNSKKTIP